MILSLSEEHPIWRMKGVERKDSLAQVSFVFLRTSRKAVSLVKEEGVEKRD